MKPAAGTSLTWRGVVQLMVDAVAQAKTPAARRLVLLQHRHALEEFAEALAHAGYYPEGDVPWFARLSHHVMQAVEMESRVIFDLASAADQLIARWESELSL